MSQVSQKLAARANTNFLNVAAANLLSTKKTATQIKVQEQVFDR